MAASINTAYADLWHRWPARAATPRSTTSARWRSCSAWTRPRPASPARTTSRTGTASRSAQASLTVIEQGSMLATIDDNGVYHDPHLITSISQNGAQTPIKITSNLVFSDNPAQNAEMDSQVQYAMSEDTASYGTAPTAALSNGQEIIAKTGTTEYAQSAFFVGAIPSQALTVALFTSQQNDCNAQVTQLPDLNNLGGVHRAATAVPGRPRSGTPTRRTVRPAGSRELPAGGVHRQHVEPGSARPARRRPSRPRRRRPPRPRLPRRARPRTRPRRRGREPEPLPDLQLRPVGGAPATRTGSPAPRRATPGRSAR